MHRFMTKAWQENGEEDACSLLGKHCVNGRLWCALACSTGCVSVHACCVLLSLKVNRCCEFKYMKTHMHVCVFVTALFFRLGLGATACSSSSGLSFSFVSSCASLICESLHNMTLDFNLYLFILFSFGLFPPFSSAMLCSSLSPSDLHCHGRALGSILSMSCCALSVVAPRRH